VSTIRSFLASCGAAALLLGLGCGPKGDYYRGGVYAGRPITARLASPSVRETTYKGWRSFELGNGLIAVEVVPEIGGRVIQFKLGEHEFLWANPQLAGKLPPASGLGPKGEWLNFGGDKLWPAPQGWDSEEQWPGPPDPVLDGSPHEIKVLVAEGNPPRAPNPLPVSVQLTSRKDPRSGIQFQRVIKVFNNSTRVSFEATMVNVDTKVRRWGIWSNTQLDGGNPLGIGWNPNLIAYCPLNPRSRFPNGYSVVLGAADNPSYKRTLVNPAYRPDLSRATGRPDPPQNIFRMQYQYKAGKVGLDSRSGWVAVVDGTRGMVFVQRFSFEQGKEYPDGSSVAFWMNGLGTVRAWGKEVVMKNDPVENPCVFESEVLGPLAKLQPGDKAVYQYDWYATRIAGAYPVLDCTPAGVMVEPFTVRDAGRRLVLGGRFGVFYQGTLWITLFDAAGSRLLSAQLDTALTPMEPVLLTRNSRFVTPIWAPPTAAEAALLVKDEAGIEIGELARAPIQK